MMMWAMNDYSGGGSRYYKQQSQIPRKPGSSYGPGYNES